VRSTIRVLTVLVIVAIACGDSADPERDGGLGPATSSGSGTTSSPVNGRDVAPTGLPLIDGLPVIDVFAPSESDAGDVPLFRWEAVEGAAEYSLAVRGPDGPLWAWRGTGTQIYFGGLPFERPPGWAGPVMVAGSCWSVLALDRSGHVMAVSELLPVSPAESPGHSCVPGEGGPPGE